MKNIMHIFLVLQLKLQKTNDHWPFLVAIFYSLLLFAQQKLKGGEVGCYQQHYGHSLQTCTTTTAATTTTTALDTASYTFSPPPPLL